MCDRISRRLILTAGRLDLSDKDDASSLPYFTRTVEKQVKQCFC